MSAIKPYLEHQDHQENHQPDAFELGAADADALAEVVGKDHTALMHTVWLRAAVEEWLLGRGYRVQSGDRTGKLKSEVFIVLDEPVGAGPMWNPVASPMAQQYRLLSWTSKMNCPSFSLPAGATTIGGSCPGAEGGQSVVPTAALTAGMKRVKAVTGREVELAAAICQKCYATGGQYSTAGVQVPQVLRYVWARQAIATVNPATGRTMFVDTMAAAIDGANFRLKGGKPDPEDLEKVPLLPEKTGRRFFRIHDSGDFFSAKYLEQWKQVADLLPDVTFWAPSRIWATAWGVKAVNEVNEEPRNFIIRPSAYHVGEAPPADLGPGWAAGSAVLTKGANRGMTPERERMVADLERGQGAALEERAAGGPDDRYSWDCRAYAANSQKHTCRAAVSPSGDIGCRACWILPSEVISYTEH